METGWINWAETLAVALHHCRLSFNQRFRSVCGKGLIKCKESLGEIILRLTSGQFRKQSNGTNEYGRDDGPAQEASFNPILTLKGPR